MIHLYTFILCYLNQYTMNPVFLQQKWGFGKVKIV